MCLVWLCNTIFGLNHCTTNISCYFLHAFIYICICVFVWVLLVRLTGFHRLNGYCPFTTFIIIINVCIFHFWLMIYC